VILSYRTRRGGGDWTEQNYSVSLERWSERAAIMVESESGSLSGYGCGRRVAILYGRKIFACRHCYGLAYPSQGESVSDRADRRAWAIRERCGGWGCLLDPIFNPRGCTGGLSGGWKVRMKLRAARPQAPLLRGKD
jgi:hypothetical protein